MFILRSGNLVERVVDFDGAVRWWDFVLSGLRDLNDPHKGRANLTEEELFQVYLTCVSPQNGVVFILLSKNSKPLGYLLGEFQTELRRRVVEVKASFSTGKYSRTREELFEFLENWARDSGFNSILASSNRVNGSALRWFEDKCKFKRAKLVFQKDL